MLLDNLISKMFGSMFKFHPNLNFKKDLLKLIPAFYRSIFNNWKTYFFNSPEITSCIFSEFLWFNRLIKLIMNLFSLNPFQSMVLTLSISYLIKMVSQKIENSAN